ncbi:aspartate/glutamate racemase family protein [Rhizobium sp. 'Codium 1']|uniref:maleate cis-trans isomerase family protein n=1 Tax=Rhizobium sp. 'Codium 1' TaxID=2940484 RepID=UPI001E2BF613|nr:aspartate/glutamate racemase family protein [Rhizobium sp. 'Codium 1']MCC8934124.1 aspartate/glutamate racemase family protein [Rhizobium sp. 'Codium 1']
MTMSHSLPAPAIGVILPSSNRVVERITQTIIADYPGLDACFSRVPYDGHPPDGYALAHFRQAADLLAQARPQIILWNATRGALLGFEPDRQLCHMLEEQTGIPATTTALATSSFLNRHHLKKIGLLAQGDELEGKRLVQTFGGEGIEIVAGRNLGITDNFEASMVSSETLERLVKELARAPLDAVLIWSTNLAGSRLATDLSKTLGIPVLDSTTLGTQDAISQVL